MASEAELKWLAMVAETGDHKEATRQCYPNASEASIPSRTSQLKAKFRQEIDELVKQSYRDDAPLMRNNLKAIALYGEQESNKLKATIKWLSNAGHDAPAETRDLTEKPTQTELKERLRMVLSGINKETLREILADDKIAELAREVTEDRVH